MKLEQIVSRLDQLGVVRLSRKEYARKLTHILDSSESIEAALEIYPSGLLVVTSSRFIQVLASKGAVAQLSSITGIRADKWRMIDKLFITLADSSTETFSAPRTRLEKTKKFAANLAMLVKQNRKPGETGNAKAGLEEFKLVKEIHETKCTCKACGNIWYYGKKEERQECLTMCGNCSSTTSNCGTSMMCCSGCGPAVFIPDKKVEDTPTIMSQCPKCNSKVITKEVITHLV